jgi:hypothetical protein
MCELQGVESLYNEPAEGMSPEEATRYPDGPEDFDG